MTTTETLTRPTTAEPTAVPLEPRERTASDVLLAAARYIEEHGWCQGIERDHSGRVCVVGALRAVDGCRPGSSLSRPASAAWDRLDAMFGGYPAYWNDTPERTEAEVLSALRSAAGTPS